MNEGARDYIRASSGAVPRTWAMDDVLSQLARGNQHILVAGDERWVEWARVEIGRLVHYSGLDPAILSQRRRGIEFRDGSALDFVAVSSTAARFMGHWWDVAFLQQFMVNPTSQEGMPCYRIPPQADWHELNDAIADAVEFLRTHQGEAEFDFQGNRYKVPYGCDYCVMVGSIFPSNPALMDDVTTAQAYAGISWPPVPQVPEEIIRQFATLEYGAQSAAMYGNEQGAAMVRQQSAAMYERARQQAAQRMADYAEKLRQRAELVPVAPQYPISNPSEPGKPIAEAAARPARKIRIVEE